MEAALFYSNNCDDCRKLKQFKSYNGISKICIDNVNIRRRLPSYIKVVPTVLINHKGNQRELKEGNEASKWFSLIETSGISIKQIVDNSELPSYNNDTNNTEGNTHGNTQGDTQGNVQNGDDMIGAMCAGDTFSSGFSDLNSGGLNDIGDNFSAQNFEYLNGGNNLDSMSNVGQSDTQQKLGNNDFDDYMNKLKQEREKLF